ncbi:MAG: hypothetical protein JF616_11925 [Fibrobacteres bacterium]|nr:hypothetical protein [Fibrobacterota bacterium]
MPLRLFAAGPGRTAWPSAAGRAVACIALVGLIACDNASGPGADPPEPSAVLKSIAADVIYPTYVDLAERADSLAAAADRLAAAPDSGRLEAARQAWRAARSPWEKGEGFLFGPVVTLPIDAPIDSWPVNQIDLQAVLSGNAALTKAYLDSLDVNLKGFHTLEYLLFGDSATPRTPESLDLRARQYLQAAAASLAGEVHRLKDAWDPGKGDYLDALADAGHGSAVYESETQGLREILFAMASICQEVANEKIYNVIRVTPPDLIQEESRFSGNSTADFADNLRSARDVYRGSYLGESGQGIGALLRAKDPALDRRISGMLDSSIAKIEAMGVFGEAATAHRDRVDSASSAIRALRAALILEAAPALGVEF